MQQLFLDCNRRLFSFVSTVSESGSPRIPGGSKKGLKWKRSSHQVLLPVTHMHTNVHIFQNIYAHSYSSIHTFKHIYSDIYVHTKI